MLKVYLIYSNFCNFCKYIVDNIDTIQQHNINTICVDNNQLRIQIMKNNIKNVPCLIIFNNNQKTVHIGNNAIAFIKKKLKESNHQKNTLEKYKKANNSLKDKLKQKKSKLQNVLQLVQNQENERNIEIKQEMKEEYIRRKQIRDKQMIEEHLKELDTEKKVTFEQTPIIENEEVEQKTYLDDNDEDMFESEIENKNQTLEEQARMMQRSRV